MAGPAIKLTILFTHRSVASNPNFPGGRIGGWSESWYFPGTNLQSAISAATNPTLAGTFFVQGLLPARAALLPTGGAIVGQRYQVVDPAGLGQSLSATYPGSSGQLADTPQTALLLRVPGLGVRNIRRVALRGIPDINVVEGEYQPQGTFPANLNSFIQALAAWQFRGRDLSQAAQPVLTIGATGLVTAVSPLAFIQLQMVRVLKAKDSSGNLRGGRFQVATVGPNANQITLLNWPFGACTGGNVRLDTANIYASVDAANTTSGRIVVKKVGRPFTQYRGRRGRRR